MLCLEGTRSTSSQGVGGGLFLTVAVAVGDFGRGGDRPVGPAGQRSGPRAVFSAWGKSFYCLS